MCHRVITYDFQFNLERLSFGTYVDKIALAEFPPKPGYPVLWVE